jgi:hypothetical protein
VTDRDRSRLARVAVKGWRQKADSQLCACCKIMELAWSTWQAEPACIVVALLRRSRGLLLAYDTHSLPLPRGRCHTHAAPCYLHVRLG